MVKANVDRIVEYLQGKKSVSLNELSKSLQIPKKDLQQSLDYLKEDHKIEVKSKLFDKQISLTSNSSPTASAGSDMPLPVPPAPHHETDVKPKESALGNDIPVPPAPHPSENVNVPQGNEIPLPPSPHSEPSNISMETHDNVSIPPPPNPDSIPDAPAPIPTNEIPALKPIPGMNSQSQTMDNQSLGLSDDAMTPTDFNVNSQSVDGFTDQVPTPSSLNAPTNTQMNQDPSQNQNVSVPSMPIPVTSSPQTITQNQPSIKPFSTPQDSPFQQSFPNPEPTMVQNPQTMNQQPLPNMEPPSTSMEVTPQLNQESTNTMQPLIHDDSQNIHKNDGFPQEAHSTIERLEYLFDVLQKKLYGNDYKDLNTIYRKVVTLFEQSDELSPNERMLLSEKINMFFHKIKGVYLLDKTAM